MNKDKLTTLFGLLGAGLTAATPVINSMQSPSMHQSDYVQLGAALMFGLLGYFTNKK